MSYVLNPRYCGCGNMAGGCMAGVGCSGGCGGGCRGGCENGWNGSYGGRRRCGWNPCGERSCDCDNRRETWPFYDGFCPPGAYSACGCACYGYFTQEGAIDLPAGGALPFDSHQTMSACMVRAGDAIRFELEGAYLVQLCACSTADLQADTVLRLTLNGANVPGGRLVLRSDCSGKSACVSAIVRAEAYALLRVVTTNALETTAGELCATLTITRVA